MTYRECEPKNENTSRGDFALVELGAAKELAQVFAQNDVVKSSRRRHTCIWSSLGTLQLHMDAGLPVLADTIRLAMQYFDELENATSAASAASDQSKWTPSATHIMVLRRFRAALEESCKNNRQYEKGTPRMLGTSTVERFWPGRFRLEE